MRATPNTARLRNPSSLKQEPCDWAAGNCRGRRYQPIHSVLSTTASDSRLVDIFNCVWRRSKGTSPESRCLRKEPPNNRCAGVCALPSLCSGSGKTPPPAAVASTLIANAVCSCCRPALHDRPICHEEELCSRGNWSLDPDPVGPSPLAPPMG
jgi:hypothetical protein